MAQSSLLSNLPSPVDVFADLLDESAKPPLYQWECDRTDCDGKPHEGAPLPHARAKQVPPAGDWLAWLILAGRGFGKTITGAQFTKKRVTAARLRWALVAPTLDDVRDTMVEGETGLLSILEDRDLRGGSRDRAWNRTLVELYLANGSKLKGFSSEKPGKLRGPQHHGAWVEEVAELKDAHKGTEEDTTWSNLLFGLRLGAHPQCVVTGTPKPKRILKGSPDGKHPGILKMPGAVVTKGTTYENVDNLAPTFKAQILGRYEGTRLGRQELHAELLEDSKDALLRRHHFDDHRLDAAPRRGIWARSAVALDPADGTAAGDEQALTVGVFCLDWRYYVLKSEGIRTSPTRWLNRAIDLYHHYALDLVVWEKNHGGRFIEELFLKILEDRERKGDHRPVAYKIVNASDGKRTRAEPISGLYEQGRVSHVGAHDELEDQWCTHEFKPGDRSPDRLDSDVWLLTELSSGPQFPLGNGNGHNDKMITAGVLTANF